MAEIPISLQKIKPMISADLGFRSKLQECNILDILSLGLISYPQILFTLNPISRVFSRTSVLPRVYVKESASGDIANIAPFSKNRRARNTRRLAWQFIGDRNSRSLEGVDYLVRNMDLIRSS